MDVGNSEGNGFNQAKAEGSVPKRSLDENSEKHRLAPDAIHARTQKVARITNASARTSLEDLASGKHPLSADTAEHDVQDFSASEKKSVESNTAMYQLQGDPPLKPRDIARYLISNANFFSRAHERLRALVNETTEVDRRTAAIRSLGVFPTVELSSVLEASLSDPDPKVRLSAVENIVQEPDDDKRRVYLEGARSDLVTRNAAIRATGALPVNDRFAVLNEILSDPNDDFYTEHAKLAAIETFYIEPDEGKRVDLFKIALADTSYRVRSHAVRYAVLAVEKDRPFIIKKGFADEEEGIHFTAAESIADVAERDKQSLIQFAKDKLGDIYELREIEATTPSLFEHELADVSEAERRAILEAKLASEDLSDNEDATASLAALSINDRQRLIDTYPEKFASVAELATRTPLYDDHSETFLEKEFAKDHSRTVLLDAILGKEGTLRNRVIRRIIPISSYLAWKKAYEAADFWKAKGFDYVPVEPIVQVKQDQEDPTHAAVDTRVLQGAPVDVWKNSKGSPYKGEIGETVNRIRDGLRELGIRHGHDTNGNFVIHFNRDAEGNPDLTQPPRVYVIDFDIAKNTVV